MMEYFFGYYEYNSLWWPISWAEEDGIPTGVRPHCQIDNKWTITEAEFNSTLQEMVKRYPRKIVEEVTTVGTEFNRMSS